MAAINYNQSSILVIEHTEIYRGILKKILMDMGASDIRVAATGKEAIVACQENQYEVVFCDFDLGRGKTGLHVLEELRFRALIKGSCVFVMVTATVDKNIVLSCLEHKPHLFITKPFTHQDLKVRLDKVLQQHQHLRKILVAMDKQDFKAALLHCQQELKAGTRYQSWCSKTQCELLFKLQAYEACIATCREILTAKTHSWAHLLLGKALCASQQHDLALAVFERLYSATGVSIDGIEAFDEAAHIHLKQGENDVAQQLLQQATDISDLSVPRLRKLAGVCEENDDVNAATKVYRKVAKHAEYSMHRGPDNHLDFARSLTEAAARAEHVESKILVAEALGALNKVNKSYQDSTTKVRANLLAAQAFSSIDEDEKANQLLTKALDQYHQLATEEKNLDVKVELVRTYVVTGNQAEANKLIDEINACDGFNAKLAARIDRISEEPVSQSGKSDVVKINSKGIKFYNEKEFKKAIEYFSKALKRFPKHTGIRLNLAQAIIAQLTLQGPDTKLIQQCLDDLAHLSHLTTGHGQYQRLTELSEKIQGFKNTHALSAHSS